MVLIVKTLRGNTLYHKPPDGGWAWVVLVSAFSVNLLVFSMSRSFGIFYTEFVQAFEASNSQVALISSIATAMIGLAGTLGGVLLKKFDARKLMLAATFLCCCGLIFSAFSSSLWMVYIGFGIIWGCGCCWTYLSCITQVNMYFSKWRGLANGISTCGTSTGSLLMPIFAQYLVSIYDWRGALIILAGLSLNGCVFASLVRPIKHLPSSKVIKYNHLQFADKLVDADDTKATEVSPEISESVMQTEKQLMSRSARLFRFLKDYWLLMLMGLLEFSTGLCVFLPVIYIVPLAKELGCNSEQAALILSLTAVGDIIVRPLAGMVISCIGSKIDRRLLFCISFVHFIQCFVCLIVIHAKDFQMLIIYSLCYGCIYGIFVTFEVMTTVSLLGVKNVEKFIGPQFSISGIASLISPPIAGYLVDTYHTYKSAYCFLMGCYAAASILYTVGGVCVKRMGGVLPEQRKTRVERKLSKTEPDC